jgi:DNA-binding MarR family transcriptional regulator
MKFESIGDKQNEAKLIRDILMTKINNELPDLEDAYGISADTLEGLGVNLFVNHNKKVLWKAGKTKFVKAFEEEVVNLIDEDKLSFEELGLLLYLAAKYTGHEDNYLRKEGIYLTKKKLIEDIHNSKKSNGNLSESYYVRKIIALEKKNLILSEPHPKDKRNKVFYLSPYLFYKGKFMDNKVKESLLTIMKSVHQEIKKLNDEGVTNIPLDEQFENKDNNMLINQMLEFLNQAS